MQENALSKIQILQPSVSHFINLLYLIFKASFSKDKQIFLGAAEKSNFDKNIHKLFLFSIF